MKKIIGFSAYFLISISIAAPSLCGRALPHTQPDFCASFKAVALCHCKESLPARACTEMKPLYGRMIAIFGSLKKACEIQKDTSPSMCEDDWKCYLSGGQDSLGGQCNSNGFACE